MSSTLLQPLSGLINFVKTNREALRKCALPRQLRQGESNPQRAENLALYGDRLLDLALYERLGALDSETMREPGELTLIRSRTFANTNLARLAERIAETLELDSVFEAP